MQLQGCYTALVTPFRDGAVDEDALVRLLDMQVENGVDGIVPVGTTGESPTLNMDEHKGVIGTVVDRVGDRCTVIAGTGANSTEEAVELTKYARDAGADATLQVTPYYNKPTQEGLYRHFATVADEGGLPVVLYHVPGRTGRGIDVGTVERLARHGGVAAVKEACGDIDRVSEICARCDTITVLSGDDSLTLPRMVVGAAGVISVASNVIPAEVAGLVRAALAGDWEQARDLHAQFYPLFRDLFLETNPIPIKAALAMTGMIAEEYRLPLFPMGAENRDQRKATLVYSGVGVQ